MINSYRPSDHTNLAHLTPAPVRASFFSFEPSASTNVVVVVVVVVA
jgi:hypothetical protein